MRACQQARALARSPRPTHLDGRRGVARALADARGAGALGGADDALARHGRRGVGVGVHGRRLPRRRLPHHLAGRRRHEQLRRALGRLPRRARRRGRGLGRAVEGAHLCGRRVKQLGRGQGLLAVADAGRARRLLGRGAARVGRARPQRLLQRGLADNDLLAGRQQLLAGLEQERLLAGHEQLLARRRQQHLLLAGHEQLLARRRQQHLLLAGHEQLLAGREHHLLLEHVGRGRLLAVALLGRGRRGPAVRGLRVRRGGGSLDGSGRLGRGGLDGRGRGRGGGGRSVSCAASVCAAGSRRGCARVRAGPCAPAQRCGPPAHTPRRSLRRRPRRAVADRARILTRLCLEQLARHGDRICAGGAGREARALTWAGVHAARGPRPAGAGRARTTLTCALRAITGSLRPAGPAAAAPARVTARGQKSRTFSAPRTRSAFALLDARRGRARDGAACQQQHQQRARRALRFPRFARHRNPGSA